MKNRLRLALAVALLAVAGACGRDAGDPVEARPDAHPSQQQGNDSLPEAGTLDSDTTCRGGVLGSGGGKQGC
jgi:hypothetical protein